MWLYLWVLAFFCFNSSVICRRHTLFLKSDVRPGILCSQFAYGPRGLLSVQLSGFSREYLDSLIGFSLEKSTTNSLVTSSKKKSEKCFLEDPTDKRIFKIKFENKAAHLMSRTDKSISVVSDRKSEPFIFASPEDKKTLKTLRPRISQFLNDYCPSEFDVDHLTDEIVMVINSDERLHNQVLGFLERIKSADLAIYESLNILVSPENLEHHLLEGDEVSNGNPDRILLQHPGARLLNEFEEENKIHDPDQEDNNEIPGKIIFDGKVPDEKNGKRPINEQRGGAKIGHLPLAMPRIPILDEPKKNAFDIENPHGGLNPKRNLPNDAEDGKSAGKLGGLKGIVPRPPSPDADMDGGESVPREQAGDSPTLDANEVSQEKVEHSDVEFGRENQDDPKEKFKRVSNDETQDDAPQLDKPFLNGSLVPNLLQQQFAAKAHDKKEEPAKIFPQVPASGIENVPDVHKPPPPSPHKPHISDFTASIIKIATQNFRQGEIFPYTFVNGMALLNFTVTFTSSSEVGAYDLVFHNCRKTPIDASILMVEKNGDNYLSLGEQPLAVLFGFFSIVYAFLAVVWGFHLRFSKAPVFRMHHLMLAMVIVKSISLMFHSINYYVIGKHGVQEEGWAVMYYIAHMTRGFLLIVTILMIGAGWTFIKHVFSRQEKQVFAVVIPLQVFANIATIVINETEQGATRFALWNEIFIVVDLLCCAGVLFPVIWSIRHLRQAAQSDGKVAQNLRKLRLFRHFYILVICYVYFTRILVYLLRMTTPFAWCWLVELFEQSVTLVFFVSVGCKFRPFNDNPYLQLPTEENETEDVVMQRFDVEEAWSQSGLADGVTRIHRPQGLDAARENRRLRDDALNRPLPGEAEAEDSDLLPLIRP